MCPINLLTIYINRMDPGHVLFFSSLTTQGKNMAYFMLIFLFLTGLPKINTSGQNFSQCCLLMKELFSERKGCQISRFLSLTIICLTVLQNFQLQYVHYSPLCRDILCQHHFLISLLFDSHFIGFPLLFHCTCFAVTLGHFHTLSFGLLISACSVLLATHQLINNRSSPVNCVDSYSAIFAVYQSPFPCRSMISSQPLFDFISSPSSSFCLTNYVVSKLSDKRISHFCVFHPSFRNFFLSL